MSSTILDRAPIDRAFFARDAYVVARDLIGVLIRRDRVLLRIVETEAYAQHDTACHAHKGLTPRTAPLFGPPGHTYVYLCYGIHRMLNMVAGSDGVAAGCLIRGAEVVEGLDVVVDRRGTPPGPGICAGPGKIGAALALDVKDTGKDLIDGRFLSLTKGPTGRIASGPRVGIDYADPGDRRRQWRFADATSKAVTHRALLR